MQGERKITKMPNGAFAIRPCVFRWVIRASNVVGCGGLCYASGVALRYLIFVVCCLFANRLPAAADEFEVSPFVTADEFPGRSWDGKDGEELKGPYGGVAKALLEAGLPDPKGLPYHEVSLPAGECYFGDAGVVNTHGWLLPRKEGAPQFVIGWNGLVYEAVRVGKRLALKEVVEALIAREVEDLFGPFGWQQGERSELLPNSVDAMHAVYLARLGFPNAVEDLLKRKERAPGVEELAAAAAAQWTWHLYSRAVCAHMRGDSRLAVISLRDLKRIRPAAQKLIGDKDGPKRWASQLDQLVADNAQRLAAKETVESFDEAGFLRRNPSVGQLVEALNEIQVPQNGQPGDVIFSESPIIKALVAKGDVAMEPLFEVLEKDTRLTRSTHFWRRHYRSRTVLTVQEAALWAVEELLQINVFELASTGDSFTARGEGRRREVVAAMRKNWERYDKATGTARWYAMLKDDEGGMYAWARAAQALLKTEVYDDEKGEWILPDGPLPGEALRDRKSPSVADLLEKRARQSGQAERDDRADPETVKRLLMMILLEWEEERGRTVIEAYCAELIAAKPWEQEDAKAITRFAGDAGDVCPKALELFDLLVRRSPVGEQRGGMSYPFVRYLNKYRDREVVRKLTAWMLEDENSPWRFERFPVDRMHSYIAPYIELEMMGIPTVRAALVKALRDDTVCGKVRIKTDSDDGPRYEIVDEGDEHGASWPIRLGMDMGPKKGTPTTFRRADVIANYVAYEWEWEWEGGEQHEFEFYWPQSHRDREIAKWIRRIRDWKETPPPGD